MAKSSKFAGMGRAGNTLGKGVPAESRAPYTPSGRGPSSPSARVTGQWRPGSTGPTATGQSSHNDIGTFMRSAKSRGPYGGPSFRSFNNVEKNYMASTPSSRFPIPSGNGGGTSAPKTARRGVSDYNNPMKEVMQRPNNRRPLEK